MDGVTLLRAASSYRVRLELLGALTARRTVSAPNLDGAGHEIHRRLPEVMVR